MKYSDVPSALKNDPLKEIPQAFFRIQFRWLWFKAEQKINTPNPWHKISGEEVTFESLNEQTLNNFSDSLRSKYPYMKLRIFANRWSEGLKQLTFPKFSMQDLENWLEKPFSKGTTVSNPNAGKMTDEEVSRINERYESQEQKGRDAAEENGNLGSLFGAKSAMREKFGTE